MLTLNKSLLTALTALPLILAATFPAAAEIVKKNPDGTKTVTEVVGYNETIEYNVPGKDPIFANMDRDGDGVLSWKDFRDSTRADNKYELFLKMDENKDGVIEIGEYRRFDRFRNRVLTESDGDNRIAVDKKFVSTNVPAGEMHSETRFVPAKRQNFGTRQ